MSLSRGARNGLLLNGCLGSALWSPLVKAFGPLFAHVGCPWISKGIPKVIPHLLNRLSLYAVPPHWGEVPFQRNPKMTQTPKRGCPGSLS